MQVRQIFERAAVGAGRQPTRITCVTDQAPECASRAAPYAALVMAPPAWLSRITGVSNQLISGSEP